MPITIGRSLKRVSSFAGVGWVGYVLAAGLLFVLGTWLLSVGLEWCVDTRCSARPALNDAPSRLHAALLYYAILAAEREAHGGASRQAEQ